MFKKIVILDYTGINNRTENQLREIAECVEIYNDIPSDDQEIIKRIGEADGVLVSYNTRITREILAACKNIRYIGMCCTLYSEESANVDIVSAREQGIVVLGIKDYGDEGVVEYVISELVRLLHGFGEHCWKAQANELTRQKVGIIGLGRTGLMIARALKFLGAELYYFSRTRKSDAEEEGINYLPLNELLQQTDIVCTCLPKNTTILGRSEFHRFGQNKILVNTSVGMPFDVANLMEWLSAGSNFYLCDKVGMGAYEKQMSTFPNVLYTNKVAGHSVQCMERLSDKVMENIGNFVKFE